MSTIIKETSNSILEYKNNIMVVRLKEYADINLETMIEQHEAQKSLVGKDKYAVLVDGSKNSNPTPEAKKYMANHNPPNRMATAIVSNNNTATVIVGNFYIKMNKPVIPTKLFKSEDKAMQWLKQKLK